MSNINVFNEYIGYTKTSTKKIIKLVVGRYFKEDIYNELFSVYEKVRYLDGFNRKKADFFSNVDHYLKEKAKELKVKYSNVKRIDDLLSVYINILYLDNLKRVNLRMFANTMLRIKKTSFNSDDDAFCDLFVKLVDSIFKTKEDYFKQFQTNKFTVKYYLTNHKKVYNTCLDYDFDIPSLYSEAAIDKVYNSGIVSEDKLFILYYLITSKMLQSVINGSFNYHYILDFSVSLFEKDEKMMRLFKIIDNDFVKDKISFKISYKDYFDNKDKVLNYINKGYNFSLVLDSFYNHTLNESKNLSLLFKYVTVDINSNCYKDFSSYSNIIKSK